MVKKKMATNREKLNNMSNEEFAIKFLGVEDKYISITCKFCIWQGQCPEGNYMKKCKENVLKWLSQEAEEAVTVPVIRLPEDENTRKAIEYIIPRLASLSARLDKLEKNVKDLDFDDTKTADEMFGELGYKLINNCDSRFMYKKVLFSKSKSQHEISVVIDINYCENESGYKEANYSKYNYNPENLNDSESITEAEDNAIHKKISELKEDSKNDGL